MEDGAGSRDSMNIQNQLDVNAGEAADEKTILPRIQSRNHQL